MDAYLGHVLRVAIPKGSYPFQREYLSEANQNAGASKRGELELDTAKRKWLSVAFLPCFSARFLSAGWTPGFSAPGWTANAEMIASVQESTVHDSTRNAPMQQRRTTMIPSKQLNSDCTAMSRQCRIWSIQKNTGIRMWTPCTSNSCC